MISCHARVFERHPTSTRVPRAQILGEYKVLLVYGHDEPWGMKHYFHLVSWQTSYVVIPRGRDLGDDKLPCRGFRTECNEYSVIRAPGDQILGEYEVLLVPVMGII